MLLSTLILASIPALAAADLTCKNYIPKSWTAAVANVYVFSGGQGDESTAQNSLPTYASVGNPWKLRYKSNPGAKFMLKTCNSTSLDYSASEQESCSHGGCYKSYTDYIQIINPYTGNCLTAQTWNASRTTLDFEPCNASPSNTAQLWLANQYVLYSPNFGKITGYQNVTLDPVQRGGQESLDYPYFAWDISRQDAKTINVIHYDYTQNGTYMNLLKV